MFMQNNLNQRKKSERGSGFVVVVILLAIVAILSTSMALIVQNNLKMAKHQEQSAKAYYLALSGMDLAVAALMQKEDTQTYQDTLYYTYFGPVNPLTPSVLPTPAPLTQTIPASRLGDGKVDITVSYNDAMESGKRWITVLAASELTDASQTTASTYMRFRLDNPEITVRSKRAP